MIVSWNGEGFVPVSKQWAKLADREYVIGEQYRVEVRHERSMASHRHYHAVIADAWANLPEAMVSDLPSPEHLRKHCLIKAGYCDIQKIVNDGARQALRIDTYAICVVEDGVTTIYTAKSQSIRAMGKAEFQKSKDAVLVEIGKLIGADPAELGKAA